MTTDCYHTARGKTAFQILIREDRQICLLQILGRICSFDLLTSLASWPVEKGNKSHLKVKSGSLYLSLSSTEHLHRERIHHCSVLPVSCSTILCGRFFPLSPASISSGAAHYCFLFMLCCAPLRESGFPLLHSSPSSIRLQHLDSTPVQQYDSMTAKWETDSRWEQWKEKNYLDNSSLGLN